jgi:predicted transcriptional regulator
MKQNVFRLDQLFGSKTRARLLALFLEHPEKAFYVRELTRKIDAQLNSVRRELQNLVDLGIVLEQVGEKSGGQKKTLAERKRFYVVNTDFMLYHDLRSLFKKVQILLKQNLVQEIDQSGKIDFLVFTGRFVDHSDIATDVLIVGDIDQKVLQKVMSAFEAEMGSEINYTLMPREEFQYRRQITDRFLFSILESENVIMIDKLGVAASASKT